MPAIRRRIREVGFRGTEQEFLEGPLLSSVFRHVDRINKTLDNWSRIRRLSIVKPFTIEGGELTPTLKVRRDKVLARHAALLDSFYEGDAG
jgi:long-chain acyl-CoA synthetase